MTNSRFQLAILFCLIFFLRCGGSKGKYFTGTLEYAYSYESSILNADSLAQVKFAKSIFRYDLNDYQSQFISKDTFTYFYSGSLNKCLSETNSRRDYECEDYAAPTDSILYFKVYDTDEKVLGHPCRILEFQSKYFWNRYYVSKDLKIAPNTYQKHLAYNWAFYGEKAEGGLILKLEHRFKNYTMKGIVTDLKQYGADFKALEKDAQVLKEICTK